MQNLLTNYTKVTLWTMILLIIAAPLYIGYDLFLRQPQKVEALRDEYVEKGSYLFAANQCFRCHGFNGEGGIGLPLNKTEEMRAREAKDPFIIKTISRGRRGTQMPPWAKEEGGPLDIEEIKALREFILDGTHWGMYFDVASVVCTPDKTKVVEGRVGVKDWKRTQSFVEDHCLVPPKPLTPEEAGKQVFNAPCAVCHNTTAEAKVGPGLLGIFQKDKLPNGKPVNDENVTEWIKKGSTTYKKEGAPFMPPYENQVNDAQIKDLIAYLKTLTK